VEAAVPEASPLELLPLKPADLIVLLVLADGPRHGYGIMKEVEHQSQGRVRLEVGSLYRLIARLTESGLIEAATGAPSDEERRRYYRITRLGRGAARAEAERLVSVIELARAKRLLDTPGRAR
jgi:DNA-binding PadR family transcriptional regulator